MPKKHLYRISFIHNDTIYEIYARRFVESEMFGFIEIEDIVFGETSAVLVDPSEERLKLEFSDVKRSYIPMHSVIRIDEVDKEGAAKITEFKGASANISNFPSKILHKPESER